MMRYLIISLILGLVFASCKPDNVEVKDGGDTVITKADPNAPAFTPSNLPLPDPCSLISSVDVANILNVPTEDLEVKDGSGSSNHSRACFYKWSGKRVNAGILIQVQKNPVGDEFPGWATSFVESKRSMGESDFSGGSENYKYSKLEGLGDDGSYSYELGKYFWRIADDYVYMVAFNEDMKADEQLSIARGIAEKILANK